MTANRVLRGALIGRLMDLWPGKLLFALPLGVLAIQAWAADEPALDTKAQKEAPTAFAAQEPVPVLQWGIGRGKSFIVPAYEIIGFEFLLNRFNHYAVDSVVYGSPTSNFSENWQKSWVIDNDKFSTNQFLHPYQGAVYQGLARSSGLGFWEAFGYTMAGSLLWEEAGEHTRPSVNDQVASGIAGNFLGEPLFRMASLLLESGSGGRPGLWRELGAAAISPSMGFNRFAHGDRFAGVFRSHDPAVFTRIDLGANLNTHFSSNGNGGVEANGAPASQGRVASADLTVAYGLPGKPGYTYTRPFDYFNFEFITSTRNVFESVFSRGLLWGTNYRIGDNYRGILGLYGSYAYVAPEVFRVSTTAASLGTTGQWWLSRKIALQGTTLAGLGYGAGGVIHGSGVTAPSTTGEGERNYHYGVVPQGLLAMRLIFGDRISLDSSLRKFWIGGSGSTENGGSEKIFRGDISLTVRVLNLHGLTFRYANSRRDGRYPNLPDSQQSVRTISVGYTLLGQTRFGAVDWRPASVGGPK